MWKTFEDIISFALQKEAGAVALYETAARIAQSPDAKAMFEELAAEERKHREILENVGKKEVSEQTLQKIPDMKMSQYVADVEFHPDMGFRDVLVLAMKREEKSKALYTHLATITNDQELEHLFQVLAQEEAKHQLRLETEYDEYVMSEN